MLSIVRAFFIGDSLSGAYYASTGEDGFRKRVLRELRTRGAVEDNQASTPGGTTRVASANIDIPEGMDLVLIELGTNDSMRTAPWKFASQYRALVAQARGASPDAVIVCVGLWRRAWRAWPYDRIIKREAARYDAAFVPLSDAYDNPATRGPAGRSTWLGSADNFHPNDLGHRVIAGRVLHALRVSGALVS